MKFDTLLAEVRHVLFCAPRALNRVHIYQRCTLAETEKDVVDVLSQMTRLEPPQAERINNTLGSDQWVYSLTYAGCKAAEEYSESRSRRRGAKNASVKPAKPRAGGKPEANVPGEEHPGRVLSHETPSGVGWFIDQHGGIEIVPAKGQSSAQLDPESAHKLGRMLMACEFALKGEVADA